MPSSVIAAHSYDAARRELTITFVTDRVYVYSGVPSEVAAAFSLALSKGIFFNARIRDQYRCRELTRGGRQ